MSNEAVMSVFMMWLVALSISIHSQFDSIQDYVYIMITSQFSVLSSQHFKSIKQASNFIRTLSMSPNYSHFFSFCKRSTTHVMYMYIKYFV